MSSLAARAMGKSEAVRKRMSERGSESQTDSQTGSNASPQPSTPGDSAPAATGSSIRQKLRESSEETPAAKSGDNFAFPSDPLSSSEPASEGTAPDTGPELRPDTDEADDYSYGATPFDDDYRTAEETESEDYSEDASQFEYRAPFTARRNPVRMWTIAATVFALMAGGTIAAVNVYGLPRWLPFNQPSFGIGKPDLVLEFPAAEQREDTLDSGEEIFRVRGTINNTGATTRSVPRLLVVFVDERGREVYSKVIVPSKSELAPGETLKVTEGISDYPVNAAKARIGWAPG